MSKTRDLANVAGALTATAEELNYVNVTTPGESEALKAVTTNASGNAVINGGLEVTGTFVAEIASGNILKKGSTKTGEYTLTSSDVGGAVWLASGADITVPNNIFADGDVVYIYNTSATETLVLNTSAIDSYLTGSGNNLDYVAITPKAIGQLYFPTPTECIVGAPDFAAAFAVELLVVGGGGSGGRGYNGAYPGGGGAGGVRTDTAYILTGGQTIDVTVGAGGAALASQAQGYGYNGNPSSFGVFESAGGGRGSGYHLTRGGTGGCGGGTGYKSTANQPGADFVGAAGNTPATDPSQGFAGGTIPAAYTTYPQYGGTGGGGAGEAGETMPTTGGFYGSDGGDGILYRGTYYGGGGGGAMLGQGGLGGGGANTGNSSGNTNPPADPNSGGGSAGHTNFYAVMGNGGSGIVIFRIPTVNYTGIHTGSPTVTVDGDVTQLVYTQSGSYTS
jgi:hypothetical protein